MDFGIQMASGLGVSVRASHSGKFKKGKKLESSMSMEQAKSMEHGTLLEGMNCIRLRTLTYGFITPCRRIGRKDDGTKRYGRNR